MDRHLRLVAAAALLAGEWPMQDGGPDRPGLHSGLSASPVLRRAKSPR
ncbi:MAG: hypothetical protein R3D34_04750 [Nitratireductor sp.]